MFNLVPLRVMAALTACILACEATAKVYNALEHGAVPDGRTSNTAAFARLMETLDAAGGGTVWVPPGRYLTGSIALVDNCTLHLEPGAELLYSGDPAESPVVPSRWECTNVFTYAPLIYANGRRNIAITGRGVINGQGWNWWWRSGRGQPPAGRDPGPAREAWRTVFSRVEAGEKLAPDDFKLARDFLRPSLVGLYHCQNVLIEGVTLFKSPMWMLHPVYSEDIVVRGVRFVSADPDGKPSAEGTGPNGDGIDVDSCRNVRISDCFFNTSDDCIVIKSGRNNDGLRTNRPTEYVTITNCVMYQGHGAVVIGSETSGGIRDITGSNCVSKGTDTGIRIKSQRGRGGVLENFRFDNWVIEDARKIALEITMRYGSTPEAPASETTPEFRNLSYSNITITNAKKIATVEGLPERAIRELRFTDITATGRSGFIADHADDLELHHVRLAVEQGSALWFDRSTRLVLDDVSARSASRKAPAVALTNTSEVLLRDSRAAAGATFLQVSGSGARDIRLLGNDLSAASSDVVFADGADPTAVTRH